MGKPAPQPLKENPIAGLASAPRARVLVFRALQLGDLLCAVPALRALRHALPRAEIVLAGLPWAREFVVRFSSYLDGFLEFPGAPGLPERVAAAGDLERFIADAKGRAFDLAIQLHGSGEVSNSLVLGCAARHTLGFYRAPGGPPADRDWFLPYPEVSEVERCLALVQHLGIPAKGRHLEFPVKREEIDEARSLRRQYGLEGHRYVCVHPGARSETRRWPGERFAQVCDRLAEQGLRVVLTGTEDERTLTEAIVARTRTSPVNLAGRTSLGGLAAILGEARLLVCNDTAVSHIAAALRVQSIVIFTASEPARWAPQDALLHRRVYEPVDCRPCNYPQCPIGHPCATGVSVDRVVGLSQSLLTDTAGGAAR